MSASDPFGLVKCWLAQFSNVPCRFRPDGQPDRAHLIPKQRLKEAYRRRGLPPATVVTRCHDSRLIVLACRQHHHLFDIAKKIRLNEGDFPERLHEYAQEFGWNYYGPAEGWRAEHREEKNESEPAL